MYSCWCLKWKSPRLMRYGIIYLSIWICSLLLKAHSWFYILIHIYLLSFYQYLFKFFHGQFYENSHAIYLTLFFYNFEYQKNGHLLILLSRLARYSYLGTQIDFFFLKSCESFLRKSQFSTITDLVRIEKLPKWHFWTHAWNSKTSEVL